MLLVSKPKIFEWDAGNSLKSWQKHGITNIEAEEVFANQPLLVAEDQRHSTIEQRHFALGVSDAGRFLFIVFTIRVEKIRTISTRPMNTKEKMKYSELTKKEVI